MRSVSHQTDPLKRFVALIMVVLFCAAEIGWATPAISASPENLNTQTVPDLTLNLPAELGRIERKWEGEPNQPFVILVRDAHAIVEGQLTISEILNYLHNHYNLKLVALEGAKGKLDGTLLQAFPDKKIKEKVLREYLGRAEITGPNMTMLLSENEMSFVGIEDTNLYEENYLSFIDAKKSEPAAINIIERVTVKLDQKRVEVYSEKLNRLHEAQKELLTESKSFFEFLSYLENLPEAKRLIRNSEDSEFAELKTIFNEIRLKNGSSDRNLKEALQKMHRELLRKLEQKLSKEELASANGRLQSFQTGGISEHHFLKLLVDLGHKYGMKPSLSEQMKLLLDHSGRLDVLQGGSLFGEVEVFLKRLYREMITDYEQLKLYEQYEKLKILNNLVTLELTREELKRFQENPESYLGIFREDESAVHPALKFYHAAVERDRAFRVNLNGLMKTNRNEAVAMVVGGFHTSSLEAILREEGMSYAVIMPAMKDLGGEENYQNVMLGKLSYGEYLEESFYDAFLKHASLRLMEEAGPGLRGQKLKSWRDHLLRDLAESKRLGHASKYTRYIDELSKRYADALENKPGGDRDVSVFDEVKDLLRREHQLQNEKLGERLKSQLDIFIREIEGMMGNRPAIRMPSQVLQIANAAFTERSPARLVEFYKTVATGIPDEAQIDLTQIPAQKRSEMRMVEDRELIPGTEIYESYVREAARLFLQKKVSGLDLREYLFNPASELEGDVDDVIEALSNEFGFIPSFASLQNVISKVSDNLMAEFEEKLLEEFYKHDINSDDIESFIQAVETKDPDAYVQYNFRRIDRIFDLTQKKYLSVSPPWVHERSYLLRAAQKIADEDFLEQLYEELSLDKKLEDEIAERIPALKERIGGLKSFIFASGLSATVALSILGINTFTSPRTFQEQEPQIELRGPPGPVISDPSQVRDPLETSARPNDRLSARMIERAFKTNINLDLAKEQKVSELDWVIEAVLQSFYPNATRDELQNAKNYWRRVAYHESDRLNTKVQYSEGGPGTGLWQVETTTYRKDGSPIGSSTAESMLLRVLDPSDPLHRYKSLAVQLFGSEEKIVYFSRNGDLKLRASGEYKQNSEEFREYLITHDAAAFFLALLNLEFRGQTLTDIPSSSILAENLEPDESHQELLAAHANFWADHHWGGPDSKRKTKIQRFTKNSNRLDNILVQSFIHQTFLNLRGFAAPGLEFGAAITDHTVNALRADVEEPGRSEVRVYDAQFATGELEEIETQLISGLKEIWQKHSETEPGVSLLVIGVVEFVGAQNKLVVSPGNGDRLVDGRLEFGPIFHGMLLREGGLNADNAFKFTLAFNSDGTIDTLDQLKTVVVPYVNAGNDPLKKESALVVQREWLIPFAEKWNDLKRKELAKSEYTSVRVPSAAVADGDKNTIAGLMNLTVESVRNKALKKSQALGNLVIGLLEVRKGRYRFVVSPKKGVVERLNGAGEILDRTDKAIFHDDLLFHADFNFGLSYKMMIEFEEDGTIDYEDRTKFLLVPVSGRRGFTVDNEVKRIQEEVMVPFAKMWNANRSEMRQGVILAKGSLDQVLTDVTQELQRVVGKQGHRMIGIHQIDGNEHTVAIAPVNVLSRHELLRRETGQDASKSYKILMYFTPDGDISQNNIFYTPYSLRGSLTDEAKAKLTAAQDLFGEKFRESWQRTRERSDERTDLAPLPGEKINNYIKRILIQARETPVSELHFTELGAGYLTHERLMDDAFIRQFPFAGLNPVAFSPTDRVSEDRKKIEGAVTLADIVGGTGIINLDGAQEFFARAYPAGGNFKTINFEKEWPGVVHAGDVVLINAPNENWYHNYINEALQILKPDQPGMVFTRVANVIERTLNPGATNEEIFKNMEDFLKLKGFQTYRIAWQEADRMGYPNSRYAYGEGSDLIVGFLEPENRVTQVRSEARVAAFDRTDVLMAQLDGQIFGDDRFTLQEEVWDFNIVDGNDPEGRVFGNVGVGYIEVEGETNLITSSHIYPEYQGQGIIRAFYQMLREVLETNGLLDVPLRQRIGNSTTLLSLADYITGQSEDAKDLELLTTRVRDRLGEQEVDYMSPSTANELKQRLRELKDNIIFYLDEHPAFEFPEEFLRSTKLGRMSRVIGTGSIRLVVDREAQALAFLSTTSRSESRSPELKESLEAGIKAYEVRDYDRALLHFEDALRLLPSTQEGNVMRGHVFRLLLHTFRDSENMDAYLRFFEILRKEGSEYFTRPIKNDGSLYFSEGEVSEIMTDLLQTLRSETREMADYETYPQYVEFKRQILSIVGEAETERMFAMLDEVLTRHPPFVVQSGQILLNLFESLFSPHVDGRFSEAVWQLRDIYGLTLGDMKQSTFEKINAMGLYFAAEIEKRNAYQTEALEIKTLTEGRGQNPDQIVTYDEPGQKPVILMGELKGVYPKKKGTTLNEYWNRYSRQIKKYTRAVLLGSTEIYPEHLFLEKPDGVLLGLGTPLLTQVSKSAEEVESYFRRRFENELVPEVRKAIEAEGFRPSNEMPFLKLEFVDQPDTFFSKNPEVQNPFATEADWNEIKTVLEALRKESHFGYSSFNRAEMYRLLTETYGKASLAWTPEEAFERYRVLKRNQDLVGEVNRLQNEAQKQSHQQLSLLTGLNSVFIVPGVYPHVEGASPVDVEQNLEHSLHFAHYGVFHELSRFQPEPNEAGVSVLHLGSGSGVDVMTSLYQLLGRQNTAGLDMDIIEIDRKSLLNTLINARAILQSLGIEFEMTENLGRDMVIIDLGERGMVRLRLVEEEREFRGGFRDSYDFIFFNAPDVVATATQEDSKRMLAMNEDRYIRLLDSINRFIAEASIAVVESSPLAHLRTLEYAGEFQLTVTPERPFPLDDVSRVQMRIMRSENRSVDLRKQIALMAYDIHEALRNTKAIQNIPSDYINGKIQIRQDVLPFIRRFYGMDKEEDRAPDGRFAVYVDGRSISKAVDEQLMRTLRAIGKHINGNPDYMAITKYRADEIKNQATLMHRLSMYRAKHLAGDITLPALAIEILQTIAEIRRHQEESLRLVQSHSYDSNLVGGFERLGILLKVRREIVLPAFEELGEKTTTGFYGAAGADISTPLILTDAEKLVLADKNPFYANALGPRATKEDVLAYLSNKAGEGWVFAEAMRAWQSPKGPRLGVAPFLIAEINMLLSRSQARSRTPDSLHEIHIEEVNRKTHRIRFTFEGKEREILYLSELDVTNPVELKRALKRNQISQFEFVLTKSSQNIFMQPNAPLRVMDMLSREFLRSGGLFFTDSEDTFPSDKNSIQILRRPSLLAQIDDRRLREFGYGGLYVASLRSELRETRVSASADLFELIEFGLPRLAKIVFHRNHQAFERWRTEAFEKVNRLLRQNKNRFEAALDRTVEDLISSASSEEIRGHLRPYFNLSENESLISKIENLTVGRTQQRTEMVVGSFDLTPEYFNYVHKRLDAIDVQGTDKLDLVTHLSGNPENWKALIAGLEAAKSDFSSLEFLYDVATSKLTGEFRESDLVFMTRTYRSSEAANALAQTIEEIRTRARMLETNTAFLFNQLSGDNHLRLGLDAIVTQIEELPATEVALKTLLVRAAVKILRFLQAEEIRESPNPVALLKQRFDDLSFLIDVFNPGGEGTPRAHINELVAAMRQHQQIAFSA